MGKISLGSGKGGDEETEQEDLLLPGPAGETPKEEGAGGAPGSQQPRDPDGSGQFHTDD